MMSGFNPVDRLPEVFEYLEYRRYLAELLKWQKNRKTGLTPKRIHAELGVRSTGFLSNVLASRKNLTASQARRMGDILGLDRAQAEYFELLVHYDQSSTLEEKSDFLARVTRLQKIRMDLLSPQEMALFSKWQFVFILELLSIKSQGTERELGELFDPALPVPEVHDALTCLQGMGLVEQTAKDSWRRTREALTTGDETRNIDLLRFQLTTMEMAKQALHSVPAPERDISVLTFSLSPEGFALAKAEVQQFRKRLASIAMKDAAQNRVYQFNIQLFPVTREVKP